MRIWFSLTLFLLSLLYLIYGLQTLTILTPTGRPGPGFFPVFVGAGLVIFTAINIYKDNRDRKEKALGQHQSAMGVEPSQLKGSSETQGKSLEAADEVPNEKYPRDVLWAVALLILFIGFLKPLGAIVSMVLFMLILLWKFNPHQTRFNILYSALFPLGIYLLFEVWLRAGLPDGILGY
ncbi:tripartite tricarboxylate transporter TctB family protein [Halomonas huangheensis]|uniref:tripartite tricarboxylate transporter TctB family protein n=1 Tax=Halomonas huangheensis TaxID=1178482 RepID=UPI0009DC05CA|nr:tripartite tricarboxylate transporter TctB family protein [Halomonas huangheensis]